MHKFRSTWLALIGGAFLVTLSISAAFGADPADDTSNRGQTIAGFVHDLVLGDNAPTDDEVDQDEDTDETDEDADETDEDADEADETDEDADETDEDADEADETDVTGAEHGECVSEAANKETSGEDEAESDAANHGEWVSEHARYICWGLTPPDEEDADEEADDDDAKDDEATTEELTAKEVRTADKLAAKAEKAAARAELAEARAAAKAERAEARAAAKAERAAERSAAKVSAATAEATASPSSTPPPMAKSPGRTVRALRSLSQYTTTRRAPSPRRMASRAPSTPFKADTLRHEQIERQAALRVQRCDPREVDRRRRRAVVRAAELLAVLDEPIDVDAGSPSLRRHADQRHDPARPHELDRLLDRLGQADRLEDVIGSSIGQVRGRHRPPMAGTRAWRRLVAPARACRGWCR